MTPTDQDSTDVLQLTIFTTYSTLQENGKVTVAGLIDADTARIIETVVQAGLLPVLVLWGVTTNVIDMAVFWRQGLTERINIGFFSLAMSDSGYLLLLFSSRCYSLISLADPVLGQYWKARSLVCVGLYTAFLNVSNLLTLLVSLDRCFCVALPLKAKNAISARNTVKLVALVFLLCLSCCSVACFKYDVIAYVNPATNVTAGYRAILTPFYRRHRYAVDAVYQYAMNVAVPAISLLGVMLATVVIAVHMRRSMTWRDQASASKVTTLTTKTKMTTTMPMASQAGAGSKERSRPELAVTRMLVVVCVVYTVCTLPTVTLAFVRTLLPGFLPGGRYSNAFYISNSLMHLLSSFNCSINFLIYYLMGTRFRLTLRMILGLSRGSSSSSITSGRGWGRRTKGGGDSNPASLNHSDSFSSTCSPLSSASTGVAKISVLSH